MTDRDDIDALAAEYVLGTLDAGERAAVAARRQREIPLAQAIEAWERRLGPLAHFGAAVKPSANLLSQIEARIDPIFKASEDAQRILKLERGIKRWRSVAGVVSALAASLILVAVGLRHSLLPSGTDASYVAVFQEGDVRPAFVMTLDLKKRILSVRPVAASTPAGKTYQIWIVSPETGGLPQSLGLVEKQTPTTQAALHGFDPANIRQATFGVSLEPEGGSPTGRPTGPALHSKLFPNDL